MSCKALDVALVSSFENDDESRLLEVLDLIKLDLQH